MNQDACIASGETLIETMIDLARCSKVHRILVAGSKDLHHMFELYRREYNRVVTAKTCYLPLGRYDVSFVDWRLHQIKALESELARLAPSLAATSVLVIAIDAGRNADHRKLRSMLEKVGFRVETGTLCERGIAIAARRRDMNQQAMAA